MLLGSNQVWFRLLRQVQKVCQMAVPPGNELARINHPVLSVLAHGFEQPVADLRAECFCHHQAFVRKGGEEVECFRLLHGMADAYMFRRLERPPTREYG